MKTTDKESVQSFNGPITPRGEGKVPSPLKPTAIAFNGHAAVLVDAHTGEVVVELLWVYQKSSMAHTIDCRSVCIGAGYEWPFAETCDNPFRYLRN